MPRPHPVGAHVRLAPALHARLVAAAEAQGVSMNHMASLLLAGGLGFKLEEEK